MNTRLPPLVIITGPPGAGKSTLARPLANRLSLPLLEKDTIKEQLADSLGDVAIGLSGSLGLAAIKHVYAVAEELLRYGNGVVIEGFFHKGLAEVDLAPLVRRSNPVLIYVRSDDSVLISRYRHRIHDPKRHPIHNDANRVGDFHQTLASGKADILDLDIPRIVIDTTFGPIDVDEVAFMVREKIIRE